MDEDTSIKEELNRLYTERTNLIIAYQEMAEAAHRLRDWNSPRIVDTFLLHWVAKGGVCGNAVFHSGI